MRDSSGHRIIRGDLVTLGLDEEARSVINAAVTRRKGASAVKATARGQFLRVILFGMPYVVCFRHMELFVRLTQIEDPGVLNEFLASMIEWLERKQAHHAFVKLPWTANRDRRLHMFRREKDEQFDVYLET